MKGYLSGVRQAAVPLRIVVTVAVFVCLVAIPLAAVKAAGGDFITSFGTSGIATANPDLNADEYIARTIVLPSGKIIAGGTSEYSLSGDTYGDFVFSRFLEKGQIDLTFGAGTGSASVRFGNGWSSLSDTTVDADGKIVAVGIFMAPQDTYRNFAIARLCPDGTLDTGSNCPELQPKFGSTGMILLPIQSSPETDNSYANAVALQPDGKIVVGGVDTDTSQQIVLVRLNPDGSVDTSFGTNGIVTTEIPGFNSRLNDLIVDKNGMIVMGGLVETIGTGIRSAIMARFDQTGTLDSTFGSSGIVITSVEDQSGIFQVEEQLDEKLVAGGFFQDTDGNQGFVVARYLPTGDLDLTFGGGDGFVTDFFDLSFSNNIGRTLSIDARGRILVAGSVLSNGSGTNDHMGIARLCQDGSLDGGGCSNGGFGNNGRLTLMPGESTSSIRAINFNKDGDILVGGRMVSGGSTTFALALLDSGELDRITLSGDIGKPGVTLTYIDGEQKTVTTGLDGSYRLYVSPGWTGTVTPTQAGATFSPASRSYTNLTQDKTSENFTAIPVTFTIAGNAGTSGVTLRYVDGTSKTATTDASGNYSFTVSYQWTGSVSPTKTGFSFRPTARSYSALNENRTNQNFVPIYNAPVLQAARDIRLYQFTIDWSAAPNASAYLLDVATDPGFTQMVAGYNGRTIQPSANPTHTVTGVWPGMRYYYRLRARTTGFESPHATAMSTVTRYAVYLPMIK
jgi:uncharacterized delta-60 repeat protein